MIEYQKYVEKLIKEKLPKEAEITSVDLEGPEIAVYTKNPKAFFENENYVSKIAFELKKRINVRTDKSLLSSPETAKKIIMGLVPETAEIKSVNFNECFSEVVIEALKPGVVIGKMGETSKRIILETGWTPTILRSPTAHSEILYGLRYHLNKYANDRKKILQETAKKIYAPLTPNKGWIKMTALGGFQQVGRSCVLVETPATKVLMDCGINAGSNDEPFPYLDTLNFSLTELDAVIIAHPHMDHMGFAPYLYKMGYRGPLYCTPPCRDFTALLCFDYIDVMVKEGKEAPYTERDVKEMMKYCITREFREVTDIAPDMKLTFHNASHIIGSASVHLHIGEGAHNLVYSSDIKYGFTRMFDNIDTSYPRVETLIVESTYGGKDDVWPQREETEKNLVKIIQETQKAGGIVLIPVFSVGRGQEVMLVLEEYYRRGDIDINAYIDGLTKEASAIHTAYPEYLRKNVQRRILQNDSPFTSPIFQEVQNGGKREEILKDKKAVILASSGMLTGGASLEYFYQIAENPANTIIFVGWNSAASLGRKIQEGIKSLPYKDKDGKVKELKVNLRVETIDGFSGHADRNQLTSFIRSIKTKPKRIIVNHGEKSKSMDFARYITNKFNIKTLVPDNMETIRLR